MQESGVRSQNAIAVSCRIRESCSELARLSCSVCRCAAADSFSADLEAVVAGLQQRYASAVTMTGSFQQTYRAPGIEQVESGVFRMKRPGLMRWEYRKPEEKLFVADGREAFLYVPLDRQVTVQPFSASDMRGTPLEFLLGGTDIRKSFVVSWENNFKPTAEQTLLIRLTPRSGRSEYEYLVLELDPKSYRSPPHHHTRARGQHVGIPAVEHDSECKDRQQGIPVQAAEGNRSHSPGRGK